MLPICFRREGISYLYSNPSDLSSDKFGSVFSYQNHPLTGYKVPIVKIGNPRIGALTVLRKALMNNELIQKGNRKI